MSEIAPEDDLSLAALMAHLDAMFIKYPSPGPGSTNHSLRTLHAAVRELQAQVDGHNHWAEAMVAKCERLEAERKTFDRNMGGAIGDLQVALGRERELHAKLERVERVNRHLVACLEGGNLGYDRHTLRNVTGLIDEALQMQHTGPLRRC
jgi:hypothetical protein